MIFFNRNNPNLGKYIPDEQLRQSSLTFVYQGKSGLAGFDVEPEGKKFLELFQNPNDLLWHPTKRKFTGRPFGIFDIRKNLSFVIHGPNPELIKLVENHAQIVEATKINALRARYGKKEKKVEPSLFYSLWDHKKCFGSISSLRKVILLSEYVSAWRLNEFGLYFFVIDCEQKILNLDGLDLFPIKEEKDIDKIPVI